MQAIFKVFRLKDGVLEAAFPVSASLSTVASDAMNAIRDGDESFDQTDLDAIASLGIEILASIKSGAIPAPKYLRLDDSEAEVLNAFLSDSAERKSITTTTGDSVFEWQVLAAYALHKADSAAFHFHVGEIGQGIESLSLACLASSDYAYHWAFFNCYDPTTNEDHSAIVAAKGLENAFTTKRMQAIPKLKAYSFQRWTKGNNGVPWKSKRSCANSIAGDVVDLARQNSWDMTGSEPERTVYRWLRENS